MKKIIKVISNCFVGLIIVVLLVLLLMNFSSKDDGLVKFGNYSLLDVNGNSMKPKLKNGDLIAIDRNLKEKYSVGDIVSFLVEVDDEYMIVTHRIETVEKINDIVRYTTKGIHNDEADSWMIKNNEIIGEYKGFRVPLIGYLVRGSRTEIGYLLLVVVPLGVVLLFSVYELIKEISKKKGEV